MGKTREHEFKNKTTHIKNLIPRRMYKERGQLEKRKHLGVVLEKKKDWKRRSENFKQKDRVIKKLSVKAQLRNPDEFYFKMKNARFQDGTHKIVRSGNQEKGRKQAEQADINLVQMNRVVESKKAEKLQNNLHMIDLPKENTHIKFVSSLDEIRSSTAAVSEPVKLPANPRLEK